MFNKISLRLALSLVLLAGNAAAAEPDWTSYQAVLSHVKTGSKNGVTLTLADYAAMNADGSLKKAYQALASFKTEKLSDRDEKLAFYINAYNILALKMVADHWPTESIKDAGSLFSPVWDKPAGELDGKTVTLGEVEHKILRPMAEPRIHFAIVCASVSCPDLRREPYTAAQLDGQLDDQARQFLNNPGKGLIVGKKAVRISRIFDWFEDDFKSQGGVQAFLNRYRTDLPELAVKADINYDWAVNAAQ